MAPRKKLGELLLDEGLIDDIQLRSAIGHQKNWGGKLGSALVELGFLSEEDIGRVLEGQLRQHCLSERELRPDPEALALVSMEDAVKYQILPLRVRGTELTLAMGNPNDFALTDELGFKLGKRIKSVLALDTVLKKAIKESYGGSEAGRDFRSVKMSNVDTTPDIINYGNARDLPPPAPEPEPKRVEPTPDLISKALAYLLIEKGIIKRDELIEKMKTLKDKGIA